VTDRFEALALARAQPDAKVVRTTNYLW